MPVAALLPLSEEPERNNQCTWGLLLIFPNSVPLESHALLNHPGAHPEGADHRMLLRMSRLTSRAALGSRKTVQNSWGVSGHLGKLAAPGEAFKCSSGISAASSQLHVWTPSSWRPHHRCGIPTPGLSRSRMQLPAAATSWQLVKDWWRHSTVKTKNFHVPLCPKRFALIVYHSHGPKVMKSCHKPCSQWLPEGYGHFLCQRKIKSQIIDISPFQMSFCCIYSSPVSVTIQSMGVSNVHRWCCEEGQTWRVSTWCFDLCHSSCQCGQNSCCQSHVSVQIYSKFIIPWIQ